MPASPGGRQNAALSFFLLASVSASAEINHLILFVQSVTLFFFLLFIFRNRGATVLGRHTEAGWHHHCRFLSWNQSQIKIVKVCHVSFPFSWQTGHQVDTRWLFDIVLLGQNAALFSRKENFKMLAPIGHIYNSCLCFLTYTSIPLIWQLEELS